MQFTFVNLGHGWEEDERLRGLVRMRREHNCMERHSL